MLNIDNSLNKPLNSAIIFTNCQAQLIIMKEFKFRHKQEIWLMLTIKAYDYDLAVINIEKCGINIKDYDFIP